MHREVSSLLRMEDHGREIALCNRNICFHTVEMSFPLVLGTKGTRKNSAEDEIIFLLPVRVSYPILRRSLFIQDLFDRQFLALSYLGNSRKLKEYE